MTNKTALTALASVEQVLRELESSPGVSQVDRQKAQRARSDLYNVIKYLQQREGD
jgi:hypothetical protein